MIWKSDNHYCPRAWWSNCDDDQDILTRVHSTVLNFTLFFNTSIHKTVFLCVHVGLLVYWSWRSLPLLYDMILEINNLTVIWSSAIHYNQQYKGRVYVTVSYHINWLLHHNAGLRELRVKQDTVTVPPYRSGCEIMCPAWIIESSCSQWEDRHRQYRQRERENSLWLFIHATGPMTSSLVTWSHIRPSRQGAACIALYSKSNNRSVMVAKLQ